MLSWVGADEWTGPGDLWMAPLWSTWSSVGGCFVFQCCPQTQTMLSDSLTHTTTYPPALSSSYTPTLCPRLRCLSERESIRVVCVCERERGTVREREGIREEGGRDQLMSLPSNQAVNRNRRPRCLIMILTPSICQWEGRSTAMPDACEFVSP